MKATEHIPDLGKRLAFYKGKELIDRLGEEAVVEVVSNVLCGTNIRSLTENLTRKRLALSNSSLLMTYLNASNSIVDFTNNISSIVGNELTAAGLTKEEKSYLRWLVGLTEKGVQNVLRGNREEFIVYLNELETVLKESAEQSEKVFGSLTGEFCINDNKTKISWPVISQIFMAIGAQTLAIRGSEKSMYGKLFEKFILGSLLSILGFEFIKISEASKKNKVFWLSERGEKRESDATLLFKPGVGVRFDIGFIGSGNTEISLDKVSRFETEMEFGRQIHYMTTLIIVDRIGEGSRIVEMAEKIGGNIIQMSMTFWVKKVALILHDSVGLDHEILEMTDDETINFIKTRMRSVDLRQFV